jgi:hypothetical protein
MARKATAKIRREVSRGSSLDEGIENFGYDAPAGRFKVDRYVQSLESAKGLSVDAAKVRKLLWRAAYFSSINNKDLKLLPDRRRQATQYLKHLQEAARSLRAASHADHEQLLKAMQFVPRDPSRLSEYLSRQNVNREYVELNRTLAKAHDAIRAYLAHNVIAPKPKGSNASDHFMRSFIELSKAMWEDEIGRLKRRDQKPFVGALLCALEDFGFSATSGWDDKFRERVRKQLFTKPTKRKNRK